MNYRPGRYSCLLGYAFTVDHRSCVEVNPRPTVECPKPKTWPEMYARVAERDKRNAAMETRGA